jgi:dTDP-4-dehydrorhamnose 3,5-epimerase
MTFELNKTKINDCFTIGVQKFYGKRGQNFELFHRDFLKQNGIEYDFKFETISISNKNVFRGFHGDFKTAKLVKCLNGKLMQFVVDIRKDSSTYLQKIMLGLDPDLGTQVLIPPGCLNGIYSLTDNTVYHYNMNQYYEEFGKTQFAYNWKSFLDPAMFTVRSLDITISDQDLNAPLYE